jgi:hypothetical protein
LISIAAIFAGSITCKKEEDLHHAYLSIKEKSRTTDLQPFLWRGRNKPVISLPDKQIAAAERFPGARFLACAPRYRESEHRQWQSWHSERARRGGKAKPFLLSSNWLKPLRPNSFKSL